MNETAFVSKVVKQLRVDPRFIAFKHADRFTHGVPDVSLTGNDFTSWWEFKVADPTFDLPGIQELTCKRLDSYGFYCRFIIADETSDRLLVVRPREIADWKTTHTVTFPFKDLDGLAMYMKAMHGL